MSEHTEQPSTTLDARSCAVLAEQALLGALEALEDLCSSTGASGDVTEHRDHGGDSGVGELLLFPLVLRRDGFGHPLRHEDGRTPERPSHLASRLRAMALDRHPS